MDYQLYIAFNPLYIADAFNIVDSDNPVCRGTNCKSPMYIDGNEYSFLILPIFIMDDINTIKENISKQINKNKVA